MNSIDNDNTSTFPYYFNDDRIHHDKTLVTTISIFFHKQKELLGCRKKDNHLKPMDNIYIISIDQEGVIYARTTIRM